MIRTVTAAAILGLALAAPAQAGAWLRAKGSGFASTSVGAGQARDVSTSAYLEYGLTDRITLGGDFYYGTDRTTFQEGTGIVFLRIPLGPTDRTHKWAAHLGLGARYLNFEFLPSAELGLSWGRGIQWRDRWGWLAVDASLNEAQSPAERRIKLDGTIGMGLTNRSKVMLQLFNTFEGGKTYTKIAPSYLFSPGGGATTFQISVEAPVAGGGETTLKIGLWREF